VFKSRYETLNPEPYEVGNPIKIQDNPTPAKPLFIIVIFDRKNLKKPLTIYYS
jgi:hypothetical protein